MITLEFTVPGRAMGKGRPRFWQGHAVTPENTRTYESYVRTMAAEALARMVVVPDRKAPCRVLIRAYFPVPASYSRKKREEIAWSNCSVHRPGKPDIDNIIKAVLDGMNGLVFADDVQVVRLTAAKLWAADDEPPRVTVMVEWAEAGEVL